MNNIFKINNIKSIFNKPYDRLLESKIMEIFNNYYDIDIDDNINRLFIDSLNNKKRNVFNLTISYRVGIMYVDGMCIKNYYIFKEPFDKNSCKNNKKTIKDISIGVI